MVHNGIVENYSALREELVKKGYHFQSETDSEVIVLLLDEYYRESHDLFSALKKTLKRLNGSWALCVVSVFEPDTIYVAKKESPMVLGKTAESTFCASDAPALLEYTKDILPLNDGDMAILKPGSLELFDENGRRKEPHFIRFPYDIQSAQMGGYDSFLLKEIHEQPNAIRETLRGKLKARRISLPEVEGLDADWQSISQLVWIGCGTAYHACLYADHLAKQMTGLSSSAIPASEFRYSNPRVGKDTLCIFVSQSGETADTMAALKLAKAKGCITIGIVNVLGSSIARLAHTVVYTCAGPEISVASTKVKGITKKIENLKNLPDAVEQTMKYQDTMRDLAGLLKDQRDAYFIGRQLDYASALEGALKLKEISYVHADAYYAGELKHGPIALIEKHTVVMALATQPEVAMKTISNIEETIARGAEVILVTGKDYEGEQFSHVIRIPEVSSDLAPVLTAVILQLFAYFTAKEKGCDIDKPRNLAKSVTVE